MKKTLESLNNLRKYTGGGYLSPEQETAFLQFQKDEEERRQNNSNSIYSQIGQVSGVNLKEDASWRNLVGQDGNPVLSDKQAIGLGIGTQVATQAFNAVDQLAMGDKNFGAQSAAIDTAVHGVSSALMKSGNPYAMCVCAGTKVYTNKGEVKNIEDLQLEDGILGYFNKQVIQQPIEKMFEPQYKECIELETECGTILRCSIDHPIYASKCGQARYYTIGKKKQRRIRDFEFIQAQHLCIGDMVGEIGQIPIFGTKHIKDAYLIGLLIGDGTYGKGKQPRLFTADKNTWDFVESTGIGQIEKKFIDYERYSKEFRIYKFPGFQSVLRNHGIFGQTKTNKRLPIDIHEWDRESCAKLIAGLIDTDGFVVKSDKVHAGISFSQSNLELLLQVKYLLLKFGIHSTISKFLSKDKILKGRQIHSKVTYCLNIKRKDSIMNFYNNITLNIDYKQKNLFEVYCLKSDTKTRDTSFEYYNLIADKIKRITKLGYLPVYNLCAGVSHTYLANNIVTHNTAGAALEGANFLTKAGGQTVQGFDVDINSSGYGNLGHKESSSSRDFGAMIGLGGLNGKSIQRKLERRNSEAQMALKAANIADTIKFEQEARMNSVDDIIQANQQALAGGIDTSLLGG